MPLTKHDLINRFEGEHKFLSNFFPAPIHFAGIDFPTSEHAFQAAKTDNVVEARMIASLSTPGKAKRAGRKVTLGVHWEDRKLQVMEEILRKKFKIPALKQLLLDTGDASLIEGNTWNDTFWGVCKGSGQNHLGRLLMKIREEVKP